MKRLLYVLAFVLASLQTFGQNADEQPVEDMIGPGYSSWVYRSGYIHRRDGNRLLAVDELGQADWEYIWFMFSGEYFYIDSETRVKNGRTYRVMKCNTQQFSTGGDQEYSFRDDYIPYDIFSIPLKDFEVCIREEDGRVYVDTDDYKALMADQYWRSKGNADYLPYEQTGEGELVLYDFNMKVGDKYPSLEGYEDIFVSRIDTVMTLDGRKRKQLELSNGLHIVEQIGCIDSSGEFLFYLNPAAIKQQVSILIHYGYRNDSEAEEQWIIQVDNDITKTRWPFDFSIVSSIQLPDNDNTGETQYNFYDLQGRRVTGTPRPGIRIRHGRKYIGK